MIQKGVANKIALVNDFHRLAGAGLKAHIKNALKDMG